MQDEGGPILRLKIDRGWVSVTAQSGKTLLEPASLRDARDDDAHRNGSADADGASPTDSVGASSDARQPSAEENAEEEDGEEDLMGDQSWAKTDDFSGALDDMFGNLLGEPLHALRSKDWPQIQPSNSLRVVASKVVVGEPSPTSNTHPCNKIIFNT